MDIQHTESTLAGDAGKLFFRAWRPLGAAHAALLIVPGFNSHSGKERVLADIGGWLAKRAR
jgi:hypothetical protein